MQQESESFWLGQDGPEFDACMSMRAKLPSNQHHDLTIANLFQIMTGCGLFFACMRFSPALAILLTVLVTPAIIRTGLVSRSFRDFSVPFSWQTRAITFVKSLGIVFATMLLALAVFVLVSVTFGLICVLVTSATQSGSDLLRDIGLIGTLGGTIWGGAGAIMSINLSQHLWVLPDLKSDTKPGK